MALLDTQKSDREFFKELKEEKQKYANFKYNQILKLFKQKFPLFFITEKQNYLVIIKYNNSEYYWYPHLNKIRSFGEKNWQKLKNYKNIGEFIKNNEKYDDN